MMTMMTEKCLQSTGDVYDIYRAKIYYNGDHWEVFERIK